MCDDLDKELESIQQAAKDMEEVFVSLTESELEKNDKPEECTEKKIIENSPDIVIKNKKKSIKKNLEKTICEKCGRVYKTRKSFKAHKNCGKKKKSPKTKPPAQNVHVKKQVCVNKVKRFAYYYKCDHCSYLTVNTKSLEAHNNKVHLGIRPYTCDICKKGFYKKSNMAQHIQTHSQQKNISCDTCGDLFVNETTLLLHKRLHTNSKPYECSMCDLKFVTSGRRSVHIKRTHMDKTEYCVYCNMKFSVKTDLKSHVKRRHAKSEIPVNNKLAAEIVNCKIDGPAFLK